MIPPVEGVVITSITPDTLFSPNEAPREAYRIGFRTQQGVTSYVRVPRVDHWPDLAHEEISAEYQRLMQFHASFPRVTPLQGR